MDIDSLPEGVLDSPSVRSDGSRATPLAIAGVEVREIGAILTRSGWIMEAFRTDWSGHGIGVQQVNYVELAPGGMTDWHRHGRQTDRLIALGGQIKLLLMDGRPASATVGQSEVIRFGALRPLIVTVPPGVWHALKNESGAPAGYLGVFDVAYAHDAPDNFRAQPGELPGLL